QDDPVHARAASLHGAAPACRAGARPSREAAEARLAGGRAEPGQPAVGLPLPHALTLRRRPLPRRGSGPARGAAGPARRLPFALSFYAATGLVPADHGLTVAPAVRRGAPHAGQ